MADVFTGVPAKRNPVVRERSTPASCVVKRERRTDLDI